jgi:hypothetical protein
MTGLFDEYAYFCAELSKNKDSSILMNNKSYKEHEKVNIFIFGERLDIFRESAASDTGKGVRGTGNDTDL